MLYPQMSTTSVHAEGVVVPQQCQSGPKYPEVEDLVGAIFNERFKIGQFIYEEYHFLTFSVDSVLTPEIQHRSSGDQNQYNFQARVYNFNNLPPKVKAYRSRNLKRIAKRTIVTENWRNWVVVIFRCGSVEKSLGRKSAELSVTQAQTTTQAQKEPQTPSRQRTETRIAPKSKSTYKRESDRLRQRDRRRAKRRRHHETGDVYTEPDIDRHVYTEIYKANKAIHTRKADLDQATLRALENMYLNSNPRPVILELLPHFSQQAMIEYLQARRSEAQRSEIHFENDYEKSEYIEIKERELVEIRRLNKKVTSLKQETNDKLDRLREQQRLYRKITKTWRPLENAIEQQCQWYVVLLAAEMQLPAIAEEGKKHINILKKETQQFFQMRDERRKSNYRQWIRHIMPGSQTYTWLHSRI